MTSHRRALDHADDPPLHGNGQPNAHAARPPRASTTPASSTTPAASRSSSTCTAASATTWCSSGLSSAVQPRPPRRHRTPRPTSATAPASSSRSPTAFLREVVRLRAAPRPARTPSASPSCPGDAEAEAAAMDAVEKIADDEGLTVLGWRDVPVDDSMIGQLAADAEPTFRQLFLARPRASRRCRASTSTAAASSPASASSTRWRPAATPSTSRPCRPARSSTRGCSSRQVGEFFPDLERRAGRVGPRPRALPVLHQHVPVVAAGPPVPASSPTTARSTRCRATRTGCGPARRCSRPTLIPGLERAFPICTPGQLRHRPLRRGPRAAAPRRALAAPRRADDDPRGVGEPRVDARLEAGLLPVPRRR